MSKINALEFAEKLNGREYRKEITKDEEILAKENNLLVLFWYSDDNMEARGVINDEIWCWEWWIKFIDRERKELTEDLDYYLDEIDDDDLVKHSVKRYFEENCTKIKINTKKDWKYFWNYNIYDQNWKEKIFWSNWWRFDIFEDWEKFCEWIVVDFNLL